MKSRYKIPALGLNRKFWNHITKWHITQLFFKVFFLAGHEVTVKEKEEAKMHVSAARENKHISLRSFEGQTEQRGFPLTMQT